MKSTVILCVILASIFVGVIGQDPPTSPPILLNQQSSTIPAEQSTEGKTNVTEDHSAQDHSMQDHTMDDHATDSAGQQTSNNVGGAESVPTETTTVKPPAAQGSQKKGNSASIVACSPFLLLLAMLIVA